MYLVHFTYVSNIHKILEDGYLYPLISQGKKYPLLSPSDWITYKKLSRKQKNEYLRSVFMTVLPSNVEPSMRRFWKETQLGGVFLLFDVSLLEDKAYQAFWCKKWNFGGLKLDNCVPYNYKKSVSENIRDWMRLQEYTFSPHGLLENEVVLKADKVPISLKYLRGIYCRGISLFFKELHTEFYERYSDVKWMNCLPE